MQQGDLDINIQLPAPELWLSDGNRNLIQKIENRSGIGFSRFGKRQKFLKHSILYKLNGISELEFTIPFQIEINHAMVRNVVVDQIVESSLIKCIRNSVEEWFCIVDIKKNMDADKDTMTISCRSLGYELMRRYVRNYKVIAQNLSSLMNGGTTVDSSGNTNIAFNGLLNGTLWQLDSSHDVTFDTIYRSVNISKATVLDAIIQIAKTFNAIVSFDTINRKINFQQLVNIGQDKGGRITYQNYMKSLENESKTDLLVTRLIPYGKNNITINSVTANGQNYIDDYSFWTSGYTRDIHGNVLTHSNQNMSDSLCGALLDYQNLLNANSGAYGTLLTSLTNYQTQLTTKQNELTDLNTTLLSIQQQLVVAQTSGTDTTTLLAQQTSQKSLITTKQSEIDTVNANITSINNSITTLQATLSTSANFTNAQITELIPYIRESDWTDSNIDTPQELYNQAQLQFTKYRTPQIVLKVDVVNLFEDILEQRSWQLFNLGDTVTVEYDMVGTNVKAKVIEISFDHAEGNLQFTLASLADLLREEEAVFQMIYRGVTAANTLGINVDNWNGIDTVAANVNALYNSNILGSKIAINAGVSNNITLNSLGLTSIVASSPNNIVRLSNGNLGFSIDGGNSYATAINAQGVNAAVITGQILLGANLNIANQSGSVTIDGNGMTISNMNMTITKTDGNSKIILNATDGIKIQSKVAGVFTDKFYVDTNGVINATSLILSQPAISQGSIVGTSINIGSGNFTVSTGGALFANSATITGNITATSGSLGNLTVTGTLTGGTLTGATINTAASGRRITLNSNAMVAYDGSGSRRISMNDAGIQSNSSLGFFRSDGTTLGMYIYQTGSQTVINAGSDTISFFSSVDFLNATVSNISQSAIIGLSSSLSSLQTNINGKLDIVNNSYVKTGASQDLKLQMFNGNLEVYLSGTFVGSVTPA